MAGVIEFPGSGCDWRWFGSLRRVSPVDPLTRLAHRARRGDRQALDELVAATYDQVWRLCAALVDRQSADDVAQEAFIRAVRALPAYRGESSARTWLLAIARYTCLDELRIRVRSRTHAALIDDKRLAAPGDASQQSTVADLVDRLDPDRRVAFVLTQMLGLSYAEAAQVCECPIGTVRSRVARARRDLIEALDDHGVGGAVEGTGPA